MQIKESIKGIRKMLGLTQEQFASELGIKRSLIGAYEEGRAEPRLELLSKMAELGGISVDSLMNTRSLSNAKLVDTKRFRNSIALVPIKAAAGYWKGFDDPDVISELPLISIPFLGSGDYRAFEIEGDSMLPVEPGTIVIGERVNNLGEIESGKTYVIVSASEGVVYKRVFIRDKSGQELELASDNTAYKKFCLQPGDILEVWRAIVLITQTIP